ncbi:MAG: MBL fold metallo-hydrolase [Mucilaginibacter sp.]|uniref:MBL fold metallo-hydrolase n=1 Tax=Mucilaginibacter sp. TaxID=1882438 RepID=UPI0031B53FD1
MENTENLKVTYLGGPTIILEISGIRFIVDPTFDEANTTYPLGPNLTVTKTAGPVSTDIGHIDAILLSHDQHYDNFDGAGRELAKKVDKVFITAEGAERMKGSSIGLHPWESYIMDAPNGDKVTITSTPARHGPAGIEKISGEVTGYIITVSGSANYELYITGDTVYYDGVAQVAKKYKPAYIFANAGGAQPRGPFFVTMSTNDVLDTSYVFPEAIVIPLHYEGWSHYTQGQDALTQSFNALGIGNRLKILPAGISESLPV